MMKLKIVDMNKNEDSGCCTCGWPLPTVVVVQPGTFAKAVSDENFHLHDAAVSGEFLVPCPKCLIGYLYRLKVLRRGVADIERLRIIREGGAS